MNDPFGDTRLSNTADGPGEIRLWPIASVVVAVFIVFVVRLFQLQVLEGEDLASRSQANYVRTVRLEAQRRGHRVDHCLHTDLFYEAGQVHAHVRQATMSREAASPI